VQKVKTDIQSRVALKIILDYITKHESRAIKEPLPGGLCPIEFATPKQLEEHPR
jgi:hypothetical protein